MNENGKKIRLLLVDDEKEFLNSTAKALSRRGFDVRAVQNAAFALKLLEDETFDVAVLDVKMPGISGDQLFREMKERWPKIPVILLTGHGTIQQAFEISQEGVFDYLTKPFDLEKLSQTARKAVRTYKKTQIYKQGISESEEIRLLIVDDELELLRSLSFVLSRRGMSVTTAQTSYEALDKINKQIFDVVLLDVKMPTIDGITLLHIIKKTLPSCEVILFTGHPSIEIAVQGVKDGAFDYLVKPQAINALTAKIRKAYERGHSRSSEEDRKQIDQILDKRRD